MVHLKRLAPAIVVLALTIAVIGYQQARRAGGARTVKVTTVLAESHPTAASLHHFKQRLEELSGGRMKADLFFNSQLGGANEIVELCRIGDVEMAQISTAILTVYVPAANALFMPFIWRNSEHQFKALEGEVGETLREEARPLGIEIMGFLDAGTRNITTKTGPIEKPEDLKGMKIRVMDSPLMVATINALGGSAVALNQGEVYTALQMGVIDGWENNPMTIVTFRMYETGCKYFAWTRHFSIPDLLIAGRPFLDRLSPEERHWVEQAAHETVLKQHQMWRDSEEDALADMIKGGMTITEVDAGPFENRVAPIYDEYYRRYGAEFKALCDKIRSIP